MRMGKLLWALTGREFVMVSHLDKTRKRCSQKEAFEVSISFMTPMTSLRASLFSYNTVERLLLGDFFHTVQWKSVANEISVYPKDWPLIGIGTTNWFKRNGEIIIQGTVGEPKVYWSDPEGVSPMHIIDITRQRPSESGPVLQTPSLGENGDIPTFPFLAAAVCDPSTVQTWETPETDHLHEWIQEKMIESNIGLAAVHVNGPFDFVSYATAFYLPLEGLKLTDGYNAKNNLKLAEYGPGQWSVGGIYAANPTVQNIISVATHPLHIHGFETGSNCGGHIVRMKTGGVKISVWPLKDLVMEIKNLDVSWQPIRNLSLA